MNKEQFTEYLLNPVHLRESSLSDLTAFVKEFPYCSTGHTLLTLKLFLERNVLYNSELKTTAVYSGSRRILKKHIDRLSVSGSRSILPDEEGMDHVEEEASAEELRTAPAREQPAPEQEIKVAESEEGRSGISVETTVTEEQRPLVAEEKPPMKEKVIFAENKKESSGISEKKAVATEPAAPTDPRSATVEELKKIIERRIREIEREKQTGQKTEVQKPKVKSKSEIIDTFIKNSPSISKPKSNFYDPVDLAKQSIVDQENIISETLAKIYMDQGYTEKALQIYEKLILKFPQKSTYFAGLIEKAKKDLKN